MFSLFFHFLGFVRADLFVFLPSIRMKMEEICSMLEQYYADLAKYAGEDWMDEEYEDGEVSTYNTFSTSATA